MTRPVLHVRYKPGFVGEARRVVHVVPAPDGGEMPDELEALCGQRIKPGEAELMAPFAGMPCEQCGRAVATALLPGDEGEPPALPKPESGRQLREALEELEAIAVQAITAGGSSARLAAHNLELLH